MRGANIKVPLNNMLFILLSHLSESGYSFEACTRGAGAGGIGVSAGLDLPAGFEGWLYLQESSVRRRIW